MSDYGKILMSTANAVGASLKKKMGSLTGYAPVDWAETINKLGNKLPERTVSEAVCTFADGADDVPMPSVKASITAVQAGSGDPSPSNVRAISGFAECDVYHTKTNLFDKDDPNVVNGKYYAMSGAEASSTGWMISAPISLTEGVTYFGKDMMDGGTGAGCNIYNSSDTLVRTITLRPNSVLSFTAQTGEAYIKLSVRKSLNEYKRATFAAGETIPVWMGGVNIWGGEKMADDVVTAVNNSSRAYKGEDTNGKYLAISAGGGLNVPWFTNFKENTQYTIILKASKSNTATTTNIRFYYTDDSTSAISFPESPVSGTVYTIVATSTANKTIKQIEGVYNSGITYVYYNESGLFEGVKTAQDFEPCRYIYGGELNLTTGVLTVTHDYIANYDGETINEPWISSIDKYVAGNSPSTGAQVVYPLTTPTTIQLTPEEVRSFLGMNNLWANTGDSEVTYFAQPNVPTEVLYKGQISSTSDYATANFTESVADDEEVLVKVYCPARSAVDYKVVKVADIGNGLNVGFNLHTTVNCTITKTSIASYQYSGDYYDIYADVLAYDSAIFN